MTTREHVLELVERLDDEQMEALERELLQRIEGVPEGDSEERPYDPLGKIIGRFASGDGVTDVSGNIHKHVADAIQHW